MQRRRPPEVFRPIGRRAQCLAQGGHAVLRHGPASLPLRLGLRGGRSTRYRAMTAGVPGLPAGLWRVHAALGRLPMTEVAAPAIALARDGHRITAFQAWCMRALEGILLDGPAGRALYAHRGEEGRLALRPQGALLQFGRTADLLDYLRANGFKTWVVSGGGIEFFFERLLMSAPKSRGKVA
mgnify:CR=1 FL=1